MRRLIAGAARLTATTVWLAAAAMLAPISAHSQAQPRTMLFMAAFSGDPTIGFNVTSVLNLQIWRTLRASAGPLGFGVGSIRYSDAPIDPPTPAAADRAARRNVTQMVLAVR